MQKDHRRKIKDEEYKQKERRRQLSINQDQEYNHFEDHWNDQNFLKMTFARPSSTLLGLIHQERNLIITKDFTRADEVRKRANELEKQESAEAQRNAFLERDKAQKKVEDKHEMESQICEQHHKKNLDDIERQYEKDMTAVMARRLKLEKDLDEMRRPHTSFSRTFTPQPKTVKLVMTSRTTQRYSAFKAERRSPSLTIEPLGKIKRKKIVKV